MANHAGLGCESFVVIVAIYAIGGIAAVFFGVF